ncbi:DNA-3-methyladenine glycosylase [Chitinophaga ginsengisoli]|uniref:Putative 3-methyladenine DNA glycosylase n=1 Tax=Chitinophaga ginsengisoli TaxID=363837 RepID=A0A2P8GGT1_9BACT|nr:DNA-3-methyladenine glycosylase [Chitinophaga ginsengisoli]PSL33194.1 DNA-3-methyladenine glycosylase [Chitinophaga ginsengisoli]
METTAYQKLPFGFYNRPDVLSIARELLGKIIVTKFNGELTTARIVETEAYAGVIDKASHAYGGRRTARTEIMYHEAGAAYVYLCYGIHQLFNIVTNEVDIPHAILIRGAEPLTGIPIMLRRTGKKVADFTLTRGPGNVSKALGITTAHTGESLLEDEFHLVSDGFVPAAEDILATPRIGVDYAGADALLPYRFIVRGNKYVSGKPSENNLR